MTQVRNPKWTGVDGEYAIVVSRGEPRRGNPQMRAWVLYQAMRYLDLFSGIDIVEQEELIGMACALIADDYIEPDGSQGVRLTREHLLSYVAKVQEKVGGGVAEPAASTRGDKPVSGLFKPVDRARIDTLLTASLSTRGTDPETLQMAALMAQENVRWAIRLLTMLGFVVAERDFTRPVGAVGDVVNIFAAGKEHAPGRMAALQESWPALHEALNNVLEEIERGD